MPEYRAPYTGTTRHPGSGRGRRAGLPYPTYIWSLSTWHSYSSSSISSMCFSCPQWSLPRPQPPPRSGKEDGRAGLSLSRRRTGKQSQVLLQALGVRFHQQPEDDPHSLSRLQEHTVAFRCRGPKCCHALFCSRETCNMNESLPLWCPGRSGQKGWSKHQA